VSRLDFANARIAARRARLLGARVMGELVARPALDARVEVLRRTHAGETLPPALGGADPIAVLEVALRGAVLRDAWQIVRDAEGKSARACLVAVLDIDEAEAVKAIVRGLSQGAPLDRILAAAPETPALPEGTLRAAASAPTPAAALELLAEAGSAVAAAARPALGAQTPPGLLPLEIAADRAALTRAREACRGGGEDRRILASHLSDVVDVRNAETVLALAGAPPIEDPFVPGGRRLGEAALARIASLGDAGAVPAAVGAALGIPPSALARPGHAEGALARAVLTRLRRQARASPLSVAVPLAFLAERRAEVRRVALLLRGTALGLPPEDVLDLAEV
jgi:V/A-type H+/Na+-transporting ATPase subunit C